LPDLLCALDLIPGRKAQARCSGLVRTLSPVPQTLTVSQGMAFPGG
jgi:hypothetical protein